MKLQVWVWIGIQKLVASFPIRIWIQIWGIIKRFSKVKLVNQEWHLVNYMILDSMIHLGDGLITNNHQLKQQQVSIWNSSENPKIQNPDFTPFEIIQNLRKIWEKV
jgi:hypothetical protein